MAKQSVRVSTASDVPNYDMDGLIVVRFEFSGSLGLTPVQMRGWWATVKSEATEQLRAWVTDPPAPTPPNDDATAMSILVPIPLNVFCDPGYDLVDEIIPHVREAGVRTLLHAHGDHTTCGDWDADACRREKRRATRIRRGAACA